MVLEKATSNCLKWTTESQHRIELIVPPNHHFNNSSSSSIPSTISFRINFKQLKYFLYFNSRESSKALSFSPFTFPCFTKWQCLPKKAAQADKTTFQSPTGQKCWRNAIPRLNERTGRSGGNQTVKSKSYIIPTKLASIN